MKNEDKMNQNAAWGKYLHLFKRLDIPAKTILLAEGNVAKKVFFIEKGCLRVCFNNDGKDVTFQFFFEEEIVSSVESFVSGQPSLFTIESIEQSMVHVISKEDLNTVLEESPALKKEFEKLIFKRLISYQKLFLARIKDNPEKRYHELLRSSPQVVLRVPQHYIASFLGITSVSLSRIRNRK